MSATPAAPQWARRAAGLAALTPVPCGLWRMAMALGVPVGVSEEVLRAQYPFPGWGTAYVLGLTVLLCGLALLTLGLVQHWGETVPPWIPIIGGRAVPRLAAVIPAGAGSVALMVLWAAVFSHLGTITSYYGLEGAALAVMVTCYAPVLLWGPLLAAVTVSYSRRRRPPRGPATAGSTPAGRVAPAT